MAAVGQLGLACDHESHCCPMPQISSQLIVLALLAVTTVVFAE